MIDGPVTIAARYATVHTITICGGYAPLEASQGETVTIKASKRNGVTFKRWTTSSPGVTLEDPAKETTTFSMPGNAVTIDAEFE
jgi:hypothetical protein